MKPTQIIHDALVESFGPLTDKTILDYGCGRGDLIHSLYKQENASPSQVLAVDANAESLKIVLSTFSWLIQNGKLDVKQISNPNELEGLLFDGIFCHNVLECVQDKEQFTKDLYKLLNSKGALTLSHHDFDSALYNSNYKEFTRKITHLFADTKQDWQEYCDGQMGRKIPGILFRAGIKNFEIKVIRIIERTFTLSDYGHLMAEMIVEIAKLHNEIDQDFLKLWHEDLTEKSMANDYYFAIDVVVAKAYAGA